MVVDILGIRRRGELSLHWWPTTVDGYHTAGQRRLEPLLSETRWTSCSFFWLWDCIFNHLRQMKRICEKLWIQKPAATSFELTDSHLTYPHSFVRLALSYSKKNTVLWTHRFFCRHTLLSRKKNMRPNSELTQRLGICLVGYFKTWD